MLPKKESDYPIDFVVTWVDDTDSAWLEKKAKYTGIGENEGNTVVRYRDWDNLKYWFRGVEKFAPFVRYIFFVSDSQKPDWLDVNHPKIKWVNHSDFIPKEYLPTFSSNPIEWNLHRIEGLAEHFVYFNDDMFVIKKTKPSDFFVNSKPCDLPCLGPLYPIGFFSYMLFNNITLLNRHFSLKESVKKSTLNWVKGQPLRGLLKLPLYYKKGFIPNSVSWHIQISYLKQTFNTIWEKEGELIHQTCLNKLRTKDDITSWCIRDWQLFSGEFYPKRPIGKAFHTATMKYNNKAINYLKRQKGKIICLNDSEDETDFELHKQMILCEFERLFPEKSSFEL